MNELNSGRSLANNTILNTIGGWMAISSLKLSFLYKC